MGILEKETKQIMAENGIHANKNLGQNFLIDDEVVVQIMQKAKISKDDGVIEIGPGLGTLTKFLLEKAGKVVAIELDKKMVNILNARFKLISNFELINADVLKTNLKEIISNMKANGAKNIKVVANLPYYITTPIIMKLLEERLEIECITVMVQKEVAQRLTAKPGSQYTGAITYSINYYSLPSTIIEVPKTCFIPSPEVDSSVIQLKILSNPSVQVENEKELFNLIKVAFMQKRKTLVNSLENGKIATKQEIEEALTKLGLDIKIRAEKLTLQNFVDLQKILVKI